MTNFDDTLDTAGVVMETQELVSAERVRSSLNALFHLGRASWLDDLKVPPIVDVLGEQRAYQLKLWTVTTDPEHVAFAILLTDFRDRSVWQSGLGRAGHIDVPRAERPVHAVGKRRATMSDEEQVEWDLRRAAAMRELGEIESRRAIWKATRLGMSQRRVGDLVGRSQPDVGRTIKKVDAVPTSVDVSPREIALRRLVGEYSDAELMARLLTLTYSHGEADPSPLGVGYLPGTWDQVRRLRDDELITDGEWRELFGAVIGPDKGPADLTLPEEGE